MLNITFIYRQQALEIGLSLYQFLCVSHSLSDINNDYFGIRNVFESEGAR